MFVFCFGLVCIGDDAFGIKSCYFPQRRCPAVRSMNVFFLETFFVLDTSFAIFVCVCLHCLFGVFIFFFLSYDVLLMHYVLQV